MTTTRQAPNEMNRPIHVCISFLQFVHASTAEAVLGALFVNENEGKVIFVILEEMGHPQQPTPFHCDDFTTTRIANNSVKKQCSCSIEMQHFWIADHVAQRHFTVHWHQHQENLTDHFTKHLLYAHHTHIRPYYLHMEQSPSYLPRAIAPSVLEGCVGTNDQGYGKQSPLPVLPVLYETWATKPMYPEAYICV